MAIILNVHLMKGVLSSIGGGGSLNKNGVVPQSKEYIE